MGAVQAGTSGFTRIYIFHLMAFLPTGKIMGYLWRPRYGLLFIGWLYFVAPNSSNAEPRCLADPHSASDESYGYKMRGQRCEGELKNFVALTDGVSLVGYQQGAIAFDLRRNQTLTVEAVGDSHESAYLRAMSVTSRARYQMDEEVVPLQSPVVWPMDVLKQAVEHSANGALDVSTIALSACSHRCADIADTVYWPVRALATASGDRELALFVRSATRAVDVTATLTSLNGDKISAKASAAANANLISAIRLPASLKPGRYRLSITAFDDELHVAMPAFYGTIVVPKEVP
ncbi:hypothetical protein [Caballeronia sp. LZ001]|uniref:hypothetical protein n=1 Tax=Caballeronia sp. LZ001 TaxID=3038553 RepID=UPI00285BABC9|nr:hypothetical protein [Caballeronia sp. LZ001]MDR5806340.1 hypothetical protein [Caballeronia sp. LZ001]